MIEAELMQFLLMIQSANHRLLIEILQAENRARQKIEQASDITGKIFSIASSLITYYALQHISDYYKLSELLDKSLQEIAPHLSKLIEKISPELNEVLFIKKETIVGGVFKKLDVFGFFSKDTDKIITVELSKLSSGIINCFKWISNPALSGVVAYQTHHVSKAMVHEFLEREYSSPIDFVTQFSSLRFDTREQVARSFVLLQLRQRLVEHHFDFNAIIQEGKLESFRRLSHELTEFDRYITNHMRIIDTMKNELSQYEFKQFLAGHYGHFALNPGQLDVPNEFCCPITLEIMQDPVTLHERIWDEASNREIHHSYHFERQAIESWIQQSHNNPLTRNVARIEDLVPNRPLREKINTFQRERAIMDQVHHTSSAASSSASSSVPLIGHH